MNTILVLASRGSSTWMLVRELQRNFGSIQIVIEDREAWSVFLKRRIRRLGLIETIGQVGFMLFAKLAAIRKRSVVGAYIRNAGLNDHPLDNSQFTAVRSVNDEQVRVIINALRPNVIVVNGTRIIHSRILETTGARFINAHFGITPMYRGVHGGYWALAQEDAKHCGITIHLVDNGVDTGQILFQETISPTKDDSFFTYPTLQAIAAIPLMMRAVRDCLDGHTTIRGSEGESRQWYHPTLWGYVWTGLSRGVW